MNRLLIAGAFLVVAVTIGVDGAFLQLKTSNFYYSDKSEKGKYAEAEGKCAAQKGTASLNPDQIKELTGLCKEVNAENNETETEFNSFFWIISEKNVGKTTCIGFQADVRECEEAERGCGLDEHFICYRDPAAAGGDGGGSTPPTAEGGAGEPAGSGDGKGSGGSGCGRLEVTMSLLISLICAISINNF